MQTTAELLLLLVVLTDLAVLGSSRLRTCIRAVAAQGLLLGLLPVALASRYTVHVVALSAGTVVVKAVVLPLFLLWAIREAAVRREVEPLVGYIASLLLGAAAVAAGFAIAARLPVPDVAEPVLVPVALATVMIGL
ncbi:MAG: hydrogenase, partial [Gemmatimonadota bacterium]|nr:hydrogenase [Gemmatimonadota bacterium]